MEEFARIVSLGPQCKARFHIERLHRGSTRETFRSTPANFPKTVFGWQVTPMSALIESFRLDFQGLFELDDLSLAENGKVENRRFGTVHPHQFPRLQDISEIRHHFPQARGRHDHLCTRTREALASPKRTLFIFGGAASDDDKRDLHAAIKARRGEAPFSLIFVDDSHLPATPGPEDWTGNHPYWAEVLGKYKVKPDMPLASRLASFFPNNAARLTKHLMNMKF